MKKTTTLLLLLLSVCGAYAQWTPVSNIPGSAADGAASFTINGKGYVCGGTGRNTLYMYDAASNTWTQKASVPGPPARAWSGYFTYNNIAYMIGGDSVFGGLLKDVWAYDPAANTWTRKADFMGGLRDGMLCWPIGNKVYVGGGFDGHLIWNDFYAYDPAADTWTQLSNMPAPILFASSFVIDGKGYATQWEGGAFYNNLIMYDPVTDTWSNKASCPGTARGEGVGFALHGKGYAGLGQTNFDHTYTDLYEYDPASDSWRMVPDSFPSQSSGWSTAFVIGNSAYVGMGTSLPDFNFSNKFYKHDFFATGIDEVTGENTFNLYPNPSAGHVRITAAPGLDRVEIFDLFGKCVWSDDAHGKQAYEANAVGLASGVYLVRMQSAQGHAQKKLVVR